MQNVIILSGITPITHITEVAPPTLTTVATLEIAIVVTGASGFVIGALVGILLYHCISKHWSQLKPDSYSHHQQRQADPEYESHHQQQQADPEYELPVSSGAEINLKENMAYEPVQRIELKGNVAYGPVQH